MKKNAMTINRETAMLLWNKAYGKACKVEDFAGREMVKAAYNDRGSEYGWNVDHILPQSKGGKTTESNLICCHILTNDEKADKFPCFTANGKRFEIVKVQNHYEIREVKPSSNGESSNEDEEEKINFFDSAAGIRFFKRRKGGQNKKIFVGTVIVELENVHTTAILDFISDIFSGKMISYSSQGQSFIVRVNDYDMPKREDTSDLLDSCVLLNTWLSKYFVPTGSIDRYKIFYGVHTDSDKRKCLLQKNGHSTFANYPLRINELVRINTEAEKKLNGVSAIGRDRLGYSVYEYNYIYTKLAENLQKQVK